jgi:ssDNA-binding Zn-finger/Zn-ribbon topoisomerase 1
MEANSMSLSEKHEKTWIAQSTSPRTPTEETYLEFQSAYSLFNNELFDSRLPDCVITLQRRPGTLGYFCRQRFINRDGHRTDEIALNPTHFAARTDVGVLSTLVHEMAHLSQFHFGRLRRAGYHCREWADRMIAVGLQPSDTGLPGGRQTGYHMTHFIIDGGPFDILTRQMITSGFKLSWLEAEVPISDLTPVKAPRFPEDDDGSHRWKFTCPKCGFNAWAKPNGLVDCGTCHILMPRGISRTRA